MHPLITVAHRGGNTVAGLRAALATGVDFVEADVHLYRNALEVRQDGVVPSLEEILAAAAGDPRLMLDLKGRSPDLAARAAATLRSRAQDVAVCTKVWPMLDAFDGDPHVRRIFSVANRLQLARLRRRLGRERVPGVSIRLRLLSAPVVADLRQATDLVLAWPLDTEEALEQARRIGVTGVIGVIGVIGKNLPLLSRGHRPE